MAKRGNRAKDAEGTQGGVRGTHGLGDIRDREKRDSQVSPRTSTRSVSAAPPRHAEISEGTGEELEFDVSNAMAELESSDDRAAKREHDAAEAAAEMGLDGTAVLDDAVSDEDAVLDDEELTARNLTTAVVPGPGPKDRTAGRATRQHLETHDLEDETVEPTTKH